MRSRNRFRVVPQTESGKALALLLLIILLGFTLRTWRLDYQALWWDEGISIHLAHQNAATILDNRAWDIHPPLYFLVLHAWTQMVGSSAWATRFLSVWFGVLTVPLLYVVGRRLFGPQTGWLAGLVLAVAPFHIHHSQEARMYTLVPFLAVLSTYLLTHLLPSHLMAPPSQRAGRNLLNQPHRRPADFLLWSLYALSITLALYTHYYAVFIPVFHGLILLGLSRRWGGLLGRWLVIHLASFLLYLPWIAYASPRLLSSAGGKVISEGDPVWAPMTFAAHYVTTTLLGYGQADPIAAAGLLMLLALVGLVAGLHRHRLMMAVPLLWLAIPVAGGWALNLWFPFGAFPRLLSSAAPALYLFIAIGLAGMARRSSWLMLSTGLLAAAFLFPAWQRYYTVQRQPDEDYRPLVRYLQTQTRTDDVIICDFPWQAGYIISYFGTTPPRTFIPPLRQWSRDSNRMEQDLMDLLASYRRVWYLAYQGLGGTRGRNIEAFLTREAYPAQDQWYGYTRLLLYGSAHGLDLKETYVEANFGDQVMLLSHTLGHEAIDPGDILPISLRWQVESRIKERFKVFVHLLNADHRVVAQRDAEPHAGALPTTDWQPGAIITDNYGVLLPTSLPPGEYTLELGLYQAITGERLPIMAEGKLADDKVQLAGTIRIETPSRMENATR